MRVRYENWVRGLTGDWLVSRQRFSGVPVPLWYPLGGDGEPRYDSPIVPDDASLPADPAASVPPGFSEAQRGQPGGFTADPDVLDTWATSSLTPQIAARWSLDGDFFGHVFPMDLRPQAHEIIRTWLFYTVLRSHTGHGALPWRHAAISGWVLGPGRKKMSKSTGDVVTPMDSLRAYGSDAVRYWAASARLGTDTAFGPGMLRVGRRLAIKVLNASRFVLGATAPASGGADLRETVTEPVDVAMLGRLSAVTGRATAAFEGYDHAGALAAAEEFFWFFCDDYAELVKDRAYGERGERAARSARAALQLALSVVLRLFAPFLPFVTEEAWSWWQPGSVHRAAWPEPGEVTPAGRGDPLVLTVASGAIAAVRAAKSGAKIPLRTPVRALVVAGEPEHLAAAEAALPDIAAAGRVRHTELRPLADGGPRYQVTL